MSSEQKTQFKKIIDAIVADDGIIALEAYTRGVIEGIALQNKYVKRYEPASFDFPLSWLFSLSLYFLKKVIDKVFHWWHNIHTSK